MKFKDDEEDEEERALDKLTKGDGYTSMMEDTHKIRTLTFDTFYSWLTTSSGKTKHEINEMLISDGINSYNEELKSQMEKPCVTISDVQKSFNMEFFMSFPDTLNAMQDRGLMNFLLNNVGCNSAFEFLDKMGVKYD